MKRKDAGTRRRQRWRRCVVACELTRQIVGTLNFLAVGSQVLPELLSRCPVPSTAQRAVWRRIEDRVKTFARLAPCVGSGLGRAIHKMRDLDEMSTCLETIAEEFARDFGGYSGALQRGTAGLAGQPQMAAPAAVQQRDPRLQRPSTAIPIIADRIKFATSPAL